jgi:raffinose/stachyose/melibiose transport system substrate-binding protein
LPVQQLLPQPSARWDRCSIAAAQTKTLTEWDSQTVGAGPKIINDAAARFEKANPGFKVESSHVLNDAYKTKLKIAFGANQPPCVFSSWGGGPLREYVKSNQVVDLTPYLQQNPSFQSRFLDNRVAGGHLR